MTAHLSCWAIPLRSIIHRCVWPRNSPCSIAFLAAAWWRASPWALPWTPTTATGPFQASTEDDRGISRSVSLAPSPSGPRRCNGITKKCRSTSDEQRRCSQAGGDAYRQGQRTGPPGKRAGVALTRDRDLTTIREFETCYIRRYEKNTGPHHQKIRAKTAAAAAKRERKAKA